MCTSCSQLMQATFRSLHMLTCRSTEKKNLPAAKYDAEEFKKLVKKLAPVRLALLRLQQIVC